MSDQDRYSHACHGRTGAARRHLQLTLPACGQPVQLARQVTREVLTAWRLAHVEETAVLLVSELVTNAVRDATSTDAITLELQVAQTWLRIEAYRCRPGLAAPRTTGEFDESGLGFALVDCLGGKWGWIAWPASECVSGTGKAAWAELDVRGEPGPQARLPQRYGPGRMRDQAGQEPGSRIRAGPARLTTASKMSMILAGIRGTV